MWEESITNNNDYDQPNDVGSVASSRGVEQGDEDCGGFRQVPNNGHGTKRLSDNICSLPGLPLCQFPRGTPSTSDCELVNS